MIVVAALILALAPSSAYAQARGVEGAESAPTSPAKPDANAEPSEPPGEHDEPALPAMTAVCAAPADQEGDKAEDGLAAAIDRRRLAADHFYAHRMYFRAISAYEEVALLSRSSEDQARARIRVAMAYHNGRQFERAAEEYLGILGDYRLSNDLAGTIRLQRILALTSLEQSLPENKQRGTLRGELEPLTLHNNSAYQIPAKYQLVRLNLLYGARQKAQQQFTELRQICQGSSEQTCLNLGSLDDAVSRSPPSLKSPWLGAALSTVVPGAGSIYAEQYVDALYYLGMTGLGSWVSLELYDTNQGFGDQGAVFYTIGSLTALIYLANVLQGYVGVQRSNAVTDYNYRQDVVSETAMELPLER